MKFPQENERNFILPREWNAICDSSLIDKKSAFTSHTQLPTLSTKCSLESGGGKMEGGSWHQESSKTTRLMMDGCQSVNQSTGWRAKPAKTSILIMDQRWPTLFTGHPSPPNPPTRRTWEGRHQVLSIWHTLIGWVCANPSVYERRPTNLINQSQRSFQISKFSFFLC